MGRGVRYYLEGSQCRDKPQGIYYGGAPPTQEEWAEIDTVGYDQLSVGCYGPENIHKFDEYMRKNHPDFIRNNIFKRNTLKNPGIDKGCSGAWNAYFYVYDRKKPDSYITDCCTKYKKNTDEQRTKCGPDYCMDSEECKNNMDTGCTSFLTDEHIKIFVDESGDIFRGNLTKFDNILNYFELKLNNSSCNQWYRKASKFQKINYVNKIMKVIKAIIDKLKKYSKEPNIDIDLQKKVINLLLSGAVRNIARDNIPEFSKLLTDFCNDDTIFKKGEDWKKLTDTYGGICNCYWDPIKDNGNPVNKEHTIIKDMQDLEGISATEKSYLQVATDIKTSGKPNCWYNECIANQGLTIDDIEQKCPLINIATCLSKAKLENKGIINAEKVEIIAKCQAEINSDWFKSNSQNKCFVTGFEDQKYLKNMCTNHNDCSMCSDIDKYMNSKEFKDLKSLSCQTNKSPDKNDLKNRCSEIQKKSDSKTDCEWCSDIDKYIKSQTPEPSPTPSPTPPPDDDSGLSNKAIFGIVVGIIFVIFMIIGIIMFI
jgi:hypothetical protein